MHRHPLVGKVESLAPPHRLGIECCTRTHERSDIGDRVTDQVAAVARPSDVDSLVEIAAARRIDGDERKSVRVVVGKGR